MARTTGAEAGQSVLRPRNKPRTGTGRIDRWSRHPQICAGLWRVQDRRRSTPGHYLDCWSAHVAWSRSKRHGRDCWLQSACIIKPQAGWLISTESYRECDGDRCLLAVQESKQRWVHVNHIRSGVPKVGVTYIVEVTKNNVFSGSPQKEKHRPISTDSDMVMLPWSD
jgi:hypothetical protein